MSIPMFMRMTFCAMAGLAAVRRYRAHQARCRSSSVGLGRPPSHHSPVAHARSIPAITSSSCSSRRAVRVVGASDAAGPGPVQDQRLRPLRVIMREQQAEGAALRYAEQCAPRASRRRPSQLGCRPSAGPSDGGSRPDRTCPYRACRRGSRRENAASLPRKWASRGSSQASSTCETKPGTKNQVGGPVTNHLIRDADPTALRVLRRPLHHSALQPRSAQPRDPITVEPETPKGTGRIVSACRSRWES